MNYMSGRSFFYIAFLIIFGGALYFFFFSDPPPPVTNFPPKGTKVLVLGDSLSEGVGASQTDKAYIGLLESRLGVTIINRGRSGDTTGMALARYDSDVAPEKPDILIVLLGGNDYLRRLPQEETFRNLRAIIERAHKDGAVVLLLGVRGGLLNDKFDNDFRDLAEEMHVLFVPNVLDGIIGHAELMADQIHPNDRGYALVADKVEPALRSLVGSILH